MSSAHNVPQDNIPGPPTLFSDSPLTPLPPTQNPTAVLPLDTGGSVFRDHSVRHSAPPGSPPVDLPPQVPPKSPEQPTGDQQPPNFTNDLAAALSGLANAIQRNNPPASPSGPPSRSKAKEPDTFYGTDPSKLRPFLMQCNLNFVDRPHEFQADRHKVIFTLSYLRGIAQSWFEPAMGDLRNHEPSWFNDYSEFVSELQLNFGPHDAIAEAEAGLAKLKMRDNQKITTYIVEFNSLSVLLEWGDAALRHRFYDGLPARLKDDVSRDGKPPTLQGMRLKAQQCDARYWERRAEVTRKTSSGNIPRPHFETRHPSSSSSSHTHAQQVKKPMFKKPGDYKPSHQPSYQHQAPPAYRPSPRGPPASSSKPKEDLSTKLGKDGKLTFAEKQRRRDNNLCLWCGKPGHMADVCPLNATKARIATAGPPAEPPSGPPEAGKA